MNLKPFLFFLAKHRGSSEIIAAIIVFAVTLTVSSISITFLSQRANLASSIAHEESRKAIFECLAVVKVVGMRKNSDGTFLVLYNPSDVAIHIAAVIVGDAIQQVNATLEPMSIGEVSIESFEEISLNRISFLTVEGVLIDARP